MYTISTLQHENSSNQSPYIYILLNNEYITDNLYIYLVMPGVEDHDLYLFRFRENIRKKYSIKRSMCEGIENKQLAELLDLVKT